MLTTALIDSLFLLCPMSELPLLDQNARLDMLDYYAAKMEAKGNNVLDGCSILEEKTDSLLKIQLTEVSKWEMQLMPNGEICCKHTIQIPDAAPLTSLHFYSREWSLKKRGK